MLNEETKEIIDTVSTASTGSVFKSNIISNTLNLDGGINCPDPSDTDNYRIEMDRLHNSDDENERQLYNDCLEKEVRDDLSRGI